MESIIRNIIKEELKKALLEISEPVMHTPNVEEILYDFEEGRSFGLNNLVPDIKGLEEYYMSDYFPCSETQDAWMFEIDLGFGGVQLVEIIHILDDDYNSFWNLKISEVERGSDQPQIVAETGPISGYNNFIERVNMNLEKKINPKFS